MALLNLVLTFLVSTVVAQKSCPAKFSPKTGTPKMSHGFTARVLGNGFSNPRGLAFDSAGHLLLVEKNRGVIALTLEEEGGCVNIAKRGTVVAESSVSLVL